MANEQQVKITIQAIDQASAVVKNVTASLQDLDKIAKTIKVQVQAAVNNASTSGGSSSGLTAIQNQIKQIESQAKSAGAAVKTAFNQSGSTTGLSSTTSQLRNVEQEAKNAGTSIRNAFNQQINLSGLSNVQHNLQNITVEARNTALSIKDIAVSAGIFGAAMMGLEGIGNTFDFVKKNAIDFNASLEMTKAGFTQLLGSAEKADGFLQQLYQFAATTPFEFPQLTAAARQLMGMGFAAGEVIPLVKAVGNAVSAVGGGAETIDRVTLALSQMHAKGKVSGEEMMQLAEAGIPAWQMLAEEMGKSTSEVMKMSQTTGIASDVMIKAFEDFSNMKWGDMMEKQSHTFNGAISTIRDNVNMFVATAFKPLFDGLSAVAQKIADFVQKPAFQQWAIQVSAYIQVVIDGLGVLADAFGRAMADIATIVFAGAAIILEGLSYLNPFVRHSPSLIESVQSGLDIIAQEYNLIASRITPGLKAAGDAIAQFRDSTAAGMKAVADAADADIRKALSTWGGAAVAAYENAKAHLDSLETELNKVSQAIKQQEVAIRQEEQALKPLAEALDNAKKSLSDLENQLNQAKQDLDSFAHANLEGTKAYQDAAFANSQATKELQLQLVNLKLAVLPAINAAQAGLTGLERALDSARDHLSQLEDQLNQAKQDLEYYANAPLKGTKAFDDAIFDTEMATKALQLQILNLEDGARQVFSPLVESTELAKLKIGDLQGSMYDLNTEYQKFINDTLGNGQSFNDALFDNDQAVKQLQFRINELKLANQQGGADTLSTVIDPSGGSASLKLFQDRQGEMSELQKQLDNLRLKGEQISLAKSLAVDPVTHQMEKLQNQSQAINLEKSLQLDPLRKQLKDLVDQTRELTFEEAQKGIEGAQARIAKLTPEVESAKNAVKGLENAVKAAGYALQDMQAQFAALEQQIELSQLAGEKIDLTESIDLDPKRKALTDAANMTPEISYDAALAGVQKAKAAVIDLTGKITEQKKVVDSLQASYDTQVAAINKQKEALDGLKQQYQDILDQVNEWKKTMDQIVQAAKQAEAAADAAAKAAAAGAKAGAGLPKVGKGTGGVGYNLPEGVGLDNSPLSPEALANLNKQKEDFAKAVADIKKAINFDGIKGQIDNLLKPLDELAKTLDKMAGKKGPFDDFLDAWNKFATDFGDTTGRILASLGEANKIGGMKLAFETMRVWIERGYGKQAGDQFEQLGQAAEAAGKFLQTLQHGLNQVSGAVMSGLAPITRHFSELGQVLTNLANNLDIGIGPSFNRLMAQINRFLPGLLQMIQEDAGVLLALITGLVTAIGTALAGIVPGLMMIIAGAMDVLAGLIQVIFGIVEVIAGGIHAIMTGNTDMLMQGLNDLVNGIGNILRGLFEIVAGIVWAFIGTIGGFFKGLVEGVVGFFQYLYDTLVGHSIIPDLVNAITTWITNLKTGALQLFNDLVTLGIGWFQKLKDDTLTHITTLKDNALSYLGTLKDNALTTITTLKDNALSYIVTLRDDAIDHFLKLKDKALEYIGKLKDDALDKVKKLKEDALEKIKDLKTEAESKFNDLKTNVTNTVETFKTDITDKFNTIRDNVKEAISALWTKAQDFITWLIKLIVPDPFKETILKGINKVKDAVSDLWDKAANFINWLGNIHVPNPFSGLGVPGVPGMAAGGIVTEPVTLVGERGPELVRLPYGSQVYPNDRTRSMLSGSSNVYVTINVDKVSSDVDIRKLAREVAREIGRNQ